VVVHLGVDHLVVVGEVLLVVAHLVEEAFLEEVVLPVVVVEEEVVVEEGLGPLYLQVYHTSPSKSQLLHQLQGPRG
jgi:hypothetical protein